MSAIRRLRVWFLSVLGNIFSVITHKTIRISGRWTTETWKQHTHVSRNVLECSWFTLGNGGMTLCLCGWPRWKYVLIENYVGKKWSFLIAMKFIAIWSLLFKALLYVTSFLRFFSTVYLICKWHHFDITLHDDISVNHSYLCTILTEFFGTAWNHNLVRNHVVRARGIYVLTRNSSATTDQREHLWKSGGEMGKFVSFLKEWKSHDS